MKKDQRKFAAIGGFFGIWVYSLYGKRGDLLQEKCADAGGGLFPGGLTDVTGAGLEGETGEEIAIRREMRDARCEGRRVVWLNEKAGFAVPDDLAGRAGRRADGRESESHPFEVDDAEALVGGGDDENVRLAEFGDERFVVKGAVKKGGRGKTVGGDFFLGEFCVCGIECGRTNDIKGEG